VWRLRCRYATSIEGATGLALSRDETKVLLVWERGSWSTPGGAIEPGENKLDGLARELQEEVGLRASLSPSPSPRLYLPWTGRLGMHAPVDRLHSPLRVCVASVRVLQVAVRLDLVGWGAHYLGGWQQSRARDNIINDNFSAFLVKVADDNYRADHLEIENADWFEWKPLLDAWRAAGKPTKAADGKSLKQFDLDVGKPELDKKGNSMNTVRLNVLQWLDRWQDGRSIPCVYAPEKLQAGLYAAKVKIG
jgi:8-oxo-dGTP pyrophosphatase MutT (NUDIX family)